MLCAALQDGESELADALSGIVAPAAAESNVVGHIQRYADYLRRFANAAEMLDLPAVKELAGFFESNALALAELTSEDRGRKSMVGIPEGSSVTTLTKVLGCNASVTITLGSIMHTLP